MEQQQAKGGSTPKYRLIYFNSRGLAEVSRLTFAAAGISFEDIRFTRDEWLKEKPKFEAGELPCLEVDGVQISQSMAILRYLGREFELDGGKGLPYSHVNVIIEDIKDFRNGLLQWFFEKDEERKKKIADDNVTDKLPKIVKKMEKLLEQNGNRYLVGSQLTIADILVFDLFDSLGKRPLFAKTIADSGPLQKHAELVKENKEIAEWLKKRPETEN